MSENRTPLYEIKLTYYLDEDGEPIVNLREESLVDADESVPLVTGLGMFALGEDTFKRLKRGEFDDD